MKLMKILVLVISLFVTASLEAQHKLADLQKLQTDIVYLSSDYLEGREAGSEGEKRAAAYLASRFAEVGLQPIHGSWYQDFDFTEIQNPRSANPISISGSGRNVVGFLDQNASKTVVIGAHFDHLGYGGSGSLNAGEPAIHNGADDNASGTAGILRLAESIRDHSNGKRFVRVETFCR